MPGMDGHELSELIRSQYPETHIVIFTADIMPEVRRGFARKGHFRHPEQTFLPPRNAHHFAEDRAGTEDGHQIKKRLFITEQPLLFYCVDIIGKLSARAFPGSIKSASTMAVTASSTTGTRNAMQRS